MSKPIRLAGIIRESIVDGPGLRFVLFTQGCPHHCKNCHNQQSWDFDGGKNYAGTMILKEIVKDPLIDGITLSGGEPFCQAEALLPLVKEVKQEGLTVMAYSGYTFEQLMDMNDPFVTELLAECNWLVDGLYVESLKSMELHFRGSSNQRILDIPTSLAENTAVLSPLHNISRTL